MEPAKLMFGRNIRDKLPTIDSTKASPDYDAIKDKDRENKEKGKLIGDRKRKAKDSSIDVGNKNKMTNNFNPQSHIVVKRTGTRLTVKNKRTGVELDRHVNHAKKLLSESPF